MGCSLQVYRCVVGLFVNTLLKILNKKAKVAASRVRGLHIRNYCSTFAVACLLLMLLIGGVEPNPGPEKIDNTAVADHTAMDSISDNNSNCAQEPGLSDHDTTQILQSLSQSVQALTGAVRRLEEGQQQLSVSVNQGVSTLQKTLNDKLNRLSEEQEVLRLDLDELSNKQERVEDDTAALKDTVQKLSAKIEMLDTERRKLNLVFFGVPNKAGTSCFQLINDVLRNQLKITADNVANMIEYAYWTGGAVLVRFTSMQQRGLVLTRARQLSTDSGLSIREDFSKEVSTRRKGLVALYKQLRSDGKRATLKADRLYTEDGLYTFDTEKQEIIYNKADTSRRRRYKQDAPGAGGPDGAAANAPLGNNPSSRPANSKTVIDVTMEAVDADGRGGGVGGRLAPGDLHFGQQQEAGGWRYAGDQLQGQQFYGQLPLPVDRRPSVHQKQQIIMSAMTRDFTPARPEDQRGGICSGVQAARQSIKYSALSATHDTSHTHMQHNHAADTIQNTESNSSKNTM